MKRKILLCALSFIAIALFSCGIAFLPNWNPKPTTPPSDIGQEEVIFETEAATQPTNTSGTWTDSGIRGTSFGGGSGTASDPYLIQNAQQLAYLAYMVNDGNSYSGKYFEQTANIDLSAYYWEPIGINNPFSGNYTANPFGVITNLYTKSGYTYTGLFGYVKNATISNIGISGGYIEGGRYTGGLVGYVSGTTTITNCYNTGEVTLNSSSSYAGGLVGYFYGSDSTITNCYNTGDVSSTTTSSNSYTGGLVGSVYYGDITNCYNTGNVSSTTTSSNSYAGGLVGIVNGSDPAITNSYNTGRVGSTSSNSYAGGLVGIVEDTATITNSYNTGEITGSSRTGGLVGEVDSYTTITIENSYNTGDVTSTSSYSYPGGLVGGAGLHSDITITNSYNTGDVTSTSSHSFYAGGLVGRVETTTITNSYNTGNVTSTTTSDSISSAGGLVGYASDTTTITNSYNTGNVTSTTTSSSPTSYYYSVGGLVGRVDNNGSLSCCHNIGDISAPKSAYRVGAIAGDVDSYVFTKCYYYCEGASGGVGGKDVSGTSENANLLGSDIIFRSQSDYTNTALWTEPFWDFDNTWKIVNDMNGNYPVLKELTEFTLTVNPNGGTWNGSGSSQSFTQNYNTIKSIPNPETRYGYYFDGWILLGSGSLNGTTFTFGGGDCILTANWIDTWLNHTTPFSGSGTEEDPYIIASAENLAYLSKQVYDGVSRYQGKYFKQTADIDLTKYYWQPIGVECNREAEYVYHYFSGVYDGNGYTISGLHTPKGSGSVYLAQGLFGMVLQASTTEIRNVTLENVDVRGGDCVGGLAGWVLSIYDDKTVTIENCSVNGKTYGDDSVGGLIGKIETREKGIIEVINCDSDVSVGSLQEDIGGIVGNVENENGIGKIVISLCNNYGDVVTNSGTYVGGVVGCFENTSSTTACLTLDQNANFGQIQGMQDVGGIIGSARDIANITNNSNMGNVSIIGGNNSVAGIAGYFYSGTMTGNTSFGDITGINYVGGLVGYLQSGTFNSNQVEGTIKGNNYVGGLVGYVASSSASATDCAVNADVIASSATDNNGLFGRLVSSVGITNCYFIGNFKNSSGTALSMTSFTGGGISPIVTNSYIIANGNAPVKKYTSLSSFKESWTIVSGVNDNNPIQKELFYLAGYTGGDEMLRVWLEDRNILSDPSFEGGDWVVYSGTSSQDTEHVRSGKYSWKFVGESSRWETYNRTLTTYEIDPTHEYFVRLYAYQEEQVGEISVYWQSQEPSVGTATMGPARQWNMYGWKFDRVGFSGSQIFRIDFDNHNQVGELWVDDVLLIDLTEMYGAGNEPSQEECMRLFA